MTKHPVGARSVCGWRFGARRAKTDVILLFCLTCCRKDHGVRGRYTRDAEEHGKANSRQVEGVFA